MSASIKYDIKVDGLQVVKGSIGIDDALHYFQQYMHDGKKVVLTIEVNNDTDGGAA